jgi:hypothetical protein
MPEMGAERLAGVKRPVSARTVRGKSRAGKRKGRVVRPPDGPEQLRLYSYLMFNLVQRIDRARRRVYAGDLDMACISEAIALSAIEARMRDPEFRDEYRGVSKVAGVAAQRGVNALSVSEATGIPRETTRRKIKKLIELGAILEVRRGEYIMKPGFLQQDSVVSGLTQALIDTTRFINDSVDQGLFLWSEE